MARSQGQRVWILGHIPPGVPGGAPTASPGGVGLEASSRAQNTATGASCPTAIVTFYADCADAPVIPDYSSQLYALLAPYGDILTLGIFGHEHMDDFRVLRDSSGNTIFGMKLVPSVTPFQGNNPAFVQFTYDPSAGTISDATTWYLTNLPYATTAAPGVWGLEYDFDSTYAQHALDSNGVAGAVTQILTQSSVQAAFTQYYTSMSGSPNPSPFLPYGCALNNLPATDYSMCYSGQTPLRRDRSPAQQPSL
jgi:sphingomyelin phosphodiesterase acid-like 3